MLTRVKEKDKIKCSQYWPKEEDEEKVYMIKSGEGDAKDVGQYFLRVRLLKTDYRKSHFVVRELELVIEDVQDEGGDRGDDPKYVNGELPKSAKANDSTTPTSTSTSPSSATPRKRHIVNHYHYVGWPDAGVPEDPAAMLDYLWDARLRQAAEGPSAGPMTVHCSAGIGRTGTFVALDCLVAALTEGGPSETPIDVQRLVRILRRQRFGMIQTLEQYEFVYKAMLVHIRSAVERQIGCGGLEDDDEDVRNYENVQF